MDGPPQLIKQGSSDAASKNLINQLLKDESENAKQKENERKKQEQASEKAARYLEEQFQVERMIQSQSKNNQLKTCEICLEESSYDEIWPLSNCGHIFHRSCLNGYFRTKIEERQFNLLCANAQCKSEVSYDDLYECLDEDLIEKYDQYALNNFIDTHGKDMSWCPTADCNFAFVFENGDSKFTCPKCTKEYCLNCRVEYHENQSCKEYQLSNNFDDKDQKFLEFVNGQKWKQCPQCKFWVEKNEGCDHMTCRCKYEFCYKCGGIYGKCPCINQVRPQPQPQPRRLPAKKKKKQQPQRFR